MKKVLLFILQMILLAACVPLTLSTPVPSLTPSLQPTVIIDTPTVTPVVITPTPMPPTATATLAAIPGPALEVGSTYRYVDGTNLVAVPEGDFVMGAAGEDNPQHAVKLSSYWIYQTEVTNSQYSRCVSASKCQPPDTTVNTHYTDATWANDPVVGVTYDQASSYCGWVHASLPTEAQWEKAARGPDGNRFPWGSNAPSCDLLNFDYCVGQTTEVTAKLPGKSYYGALDMAGNVLEWTADWYDPAYYSTAPRSDPTGPEQGEKRVVRSSSYASGADASMPAQRYSRSPGEYSEEIGFRCAVQEPAYYVPFCQQNALYGVDATGKSIVTDPPSPQCADLSIKMGQSCGAGGQPMTVITFNGPNNATISAPDCIQDSQSNIYTCLEPKEVSICMECFFPQLGNPVCGEHYTADGAACLWDGKVTQSAQCLDVDTFDPANHCCVAGSITSTTCPAGFYYLEKQKGCVPYPAMSTYCLQETVAIKSCQ